MIDKKEWIRTRAYFISLLRQRLGNPQSSEDDWIEAEWEYEQFEEHNQRFHEICDIRG